MGIRLNKVIGYGLTDVASLDGRIADPRINNGSPWIYGQDPEQSYADWLKDRLTGDDTDDLEIQLELAMLEARGGAADAHRACAWERKDYRRGGALLVRPVGYTNWHRYGDVIDTEEEYARHGAMVSRTLTLPDGIFPFSGLWMDARTGEQLKEPHASIWQRVARQPDGTRDRDRALDLMAKTLCFQDRAEAARSIVPFVPPEVRRICEWAQLFSSPEVCFQLRPLLYCYWS
ncbi:hypothetical protein [Streptomyces europaeiscabiei]|uniref:hypothetical protein n=1 Tax=Streptomyces europaeiscabiei TaxID=146819 RepID=UPI0038F6C57D